MDNNRIYQPGRKIKAIYHDELGGDPDGLIRIWDDGVRYYILRNDDTRTVVPIHDVAEERTDHIAAALRDFSPIH